MGSSLTKLETENKDQASSESCLDTNTCPQKRRLSRMSLFGDNLETLDPRRSHFTTSDISKEKNISTEKSHLHTPTRLPSEREVSLYYHASQDYNGNKEPLTQTDSVSWTCMPISIEAYHALDHPELRVIDPKRPATLLYRCPLCDVRTQAPKQWRLQFDHYIDTHWLPRRYVGEFVCFPCRNTHNATILSKLIEDSKARESVCNLSQIQPKRILRPQRHRVIVRGDDHDNSVYSLLSNSGLIEVPIHHHCPSPSCEDLVFLNFVDLENHCAVAHCNTELDPKLTPADPKKLHAPFLDESVYVLPLCFDETASTTCRARSSSSDVSTAFGAEKSFIRRQLCLPPTFSPYGSSVLTEASISLFRSPNSPQRFTQVIGSPPLRKRKRDLDEEAEGRRSCLITPASSSRAKRRQVGFNGTVFQRTYDKQLSLVEKCGSSLGPSIETDEATKSSEVAAAEATDCNRSVDECIIIEATDEIKKPQPHKRLKLDVNYEPSNSRQQRCPDMQPNGLTLNDCKKITIP